MKIQAYPHAVWDPELNSYIEHGDYDDKYYSFEYKGKFFYCKDYRCFETTELIDIRDIYLEADHPRTPNDITVTYRGKSLDNFIICEYNGPDPRITVKPQKPTD